MLPASYRCELSVFLAVASLARTATPKAIHLASKLRVCDAAVLQAGAAAGKVVVLLMLE